MFTRRFLCLQKRFYTNLNPFCTLRNNVVSEIGVTSTYLLNKQIPNLYTVNRLKHKKSKQKERIFEDEDSEDEDLSDLVEPHEKVITRNVSSLRLDTIVKAGLGIGRNKVDVAFLESKIRINGNKVLKKSVEVYEGDEIDVFVEKSQENPNCIIIHRLRFVSKTEVPSGFKVSLVRDKSLMIENYK